MTVVSIFAWAVCCIYATIPSFWFVIHPFAERWRKHSGPKYKIFLPLWITMWIVAGAATWPWRNVRLYSAPWAWAPAVALLALGAFLYVTASRGFSGEQLGGLPEVESHKTQRLVRGGIRERVRHPIYLGHLCEMLGWSIGTAMAVLFALTAFAVITGILMIRMEEAELSRRFGAEWQSYRRQVPAILPRL